MPHVAQSAGPFPFPSPRSAFALLSVYSLTLCALLRELAGVGSKPFLGFTAGVVVNVIVGFLGFLLSAVVFANYWKGVFTAPSDAQIG